MSPQGKSRIERLLEHATRSSVWSYSWHKDDASAKKFVALEMTNKWLGFTPTKFWLKRVWGGGTRVCIEGYTKEGSQLCTI